MSDHEARVLLAAPDVSILPGLRNRATLAFRINMTFCELLPQLNQDATRCAYPIGQFVIQLVIAGTVEIWRLDRIGRSLGELVAMVDQLEAAGVGFESLTERIDTSTAAGELVFHEFGAIAQFERHLIVERKRGGVAAGTRERLKGRLSGRTDDTIAAARTLTTSDRTPGEICKVLGIARSTFYKDAGCRPTEPRSVKSSLFINLRGSLEHMGSERPGA